MEGFNLEKTEADFAGVVGENGQEEVVVGVAKIEKESTLDKIVDNPEFLLNPNLMTKQGKAVFYTNLVVAGLILVAALLSLLTMTVRVFQTLSPQLWIFLGMEGG